VARSRLRTPRGEIDVEVVGSRTVVTRGVLVDITPMRQAISALRASEELNRTVVATLAEGIVVLDGAGTAVTWNESALVLLGDRLETLAEALAHSDGRVELEAGGRQLVICHQPLNTPGGGTVCSIEDITERLAAEGRLREERDRAQRYLDVASTIIVVVGTDGRVELVNRKGCEVLGREECALIGADWFATVVPAGERGDARHAFARLMASPAEHEERFESTVVTQDGDERLISWHSALLTDADGAVAGVLRSGEDVTDHRLAEEQVRYLAYHDKLTGLANRTLLEEHLAMAVARARRNGTEIALLCFDLDGFGLVNDSLGHTAGDEVLRLTAQRVRDVTRANDLLARPGGDEFVLLLSDLDQGAAEAATVVGRLIRDSLAPAFRVAGAEFHLGASIGVSLFPQHADNADDLLRRADVAMEQAKRRGNGPAFFEPAAVDARTRLSLSARLRRALERDEFVLHFQPVFSPEDERLRGAEALIRWEDPERGLVGPGEFIPAAEDCGLIEGIGEWVLDALCRQAHDWQTAGAPPIRLSFNLSPRELRRADIVPSIIERVSAYGLDPGRFCVEVTESSAMSQPGRTGALVRDLHEAGFELAIDDFGTGHSSLTRLRELPFHVLKIDRSFLAPVPHDPQAGAIVAAVLTLAKALGMTTVAEGVETAAQQAFLVQEGCPLVQGFHLGRPVPAAQLADLLRRDARFSR
jgi:diguanylate cyclase (GGDEF)-like protein/PAS domain S-box-containing protein